MSTAVRAFVALRLPDAVRDSLARARVEVPVTRAIASYWRPAVLGALVWAVTLEAPLLAGDYNLFDPSVLRPWVSSHR